MQMKCFNFNRKVYNRMTYVRKIVFLFCCGLNAIFKIMILFSCLSIFANGIRVLMKVFCALIIIKFISGKLEKKLIIKTPE